MAMTAIILVALSTFVYQISTTIAAPANAVFSNPALSLTQLNESIPKIQTLTSRFAVREIPIAKTQQC